MKNERRKLMDVYRKNFNNSDFILGKLRLILLVFLGNSVIMAFVWRSLNEMTAQFVWKHISFQTVSPANSLLLLSSNYFV